MASIRNLLIVEDNTEWCLAYARAAVREGGVTVRTAADLDAAQDLIDEMQFAVAFVDIGLNAGDDQNVDGLRVMAKIRAAGDNTSIVVVTGRSGRDVLPIAVDALKVYGAVEVAAKADIGPDRVGALLRKGLTEFERRTGDARAAAIESLRGAVDPWRWDDQILRATGVRGGIAGLHGFLEQLLAQFVPLVPRQTGRAADLDEPAGVVHGSYWSRAIGKPVVACFASADRGRAELGLARSTGMFLDRYEVDNVLAESTGHGLAGAVLGLKVSNRREFHQERSEDPRSVGTAIPPQGSSGVTASRPHQPRGKD